VAISKPSRSLLATVYRGFRRALRVVTRPVRRDRGLKGVLIQPYRGYGTPEEAFLTGRVFRQPRFGARLPAGTMRRQLADALRRLARWGLGGVRITAELGDANTRVDTDADGYFRVTLPLRQHPNPDRLWHHMTLAAEWEGVRVREIGSVFIPPTSARRVVISDIDDTVMLTGVANKILMMWRLFVQGAENRTAFPGVSALYRALHGGVGGDEQNPMLYVSRGPWSIYEVLERFFQIQEIPIGPILFLREWGLTLQRPLPKRAEDHKRDLIRGMLERYDALPFILIGDSGQHDPETYARVVEEHPGRVLAVYIRNVSPGDARGGEIDALARRTAEAGCPLVLASDSRTMAEHAAEKGWISRAGVDDVARERRAETDEPGRPAGREPLSVPSERAEEAARSAPDGEAPPDVVVEQ
jgi:phosphatidate phosphatase APP1